MNFEKSLKLIMKSALDAAKPRGKFRNLPQKPKGKLIVLGAGKAGASMAQEFENTYDGPVEGLVITRYGHYTKTKFIKIIEASHPEPDKNGLIASKKIFELATKSSKDDHVVFLISGGASSLLTFPAKGVSFEEKQRINKELLRCGAPINEMNIVRRSLSQIKGGRLAQAIFPAKLTTYMISDIPGDDPAYIGSGPTIQANGLNKDSIKILEKYEISINANKLSELKNLSRLVDDILNKHPNNHQPYVGENAFAHKGGLHVSAVMKDPTTYEHVNPELVGNNRKILVSNQAGRSNLLSRLKSIGMEIDSDDKRINTLLDIVKEREYMGYSYDGAGASFEILAKNILDQVPSFFSVENYEVTIAGSKDKSSLSKANIVLNVDERIINSTGEGNGPVNALDNALRKDLGIYNEYIQDLTLVDYKVRILDGGTEAITRVVIESSDSKNQSWFTVGISPNIIEASFEALMDSINYKLIKSDIK